MELREKKVLIIIGDWNRKFGATFDMSFLVEELLNEGTHVDLLITQKRAPDHFSFVQTSTGLATEALNSTSTGTVGQFIEAAKADLVLIVGERPKILYLLMQIVSKVVFMQFDTKITCPAKTRFLPVSGKICEVPCGPSCFNVSATENCLGNRPFHKKLVLVVKRYLDMRMLKLFRYFTVNSQTTLKRFRRKGALFYPPVQIGPPVDILQDDRRPKHIVFVGRLEKIKGGFDALNIFSKSRHARHLHIIGDGRLRSFLVQEAENLGVRDRVTFHGWIDPKARDILMASCDLSLVTSKCDEAFGRIGPESFAVGTPVVAYDAGGTREWCIAPAGTLVDCSDLQGAAEAVDRLLDDDARIAAARAACRNHLERFSDIAFRAEWRAYLDRL